MGSEGNGSPFSALFSPLSVFCLCSHRIVCEKGQNYSVSRNLLMKRDIKKILHLFLLTAQICRENPTIFDNKKQIYFATLIDFMKHNFHHDEQNNTNGAWLEWCWGGLPCSRAHWKVPSGFEYYWDFREDNECYLHPSALIKCWCCFGKLLSCHKRLRSTY